MKRMSFGAAFAWERLFILIDVTLRSRLQKPYASIVAKVNSAGQLYRTGKPETPNPRET